MKKVFEKLTLLDLVTISMMAALGIAVKVVLVPLVHIITGPLFIPGGSISGGIYMLFIVLAALLVRKTGAALLVCLIQTILVIITGTMGSHGIMSIVTYLMPGIGVELLYLILGKYKYTKGASFGAGVIANVLGSFGVNFVFFRLPLVPLLLTLCLASLSGGLGGLLAYAIASQLKKFGYFKDQEIVAEDDIRLSGDPEEENEIAKKD
ncbi:ECF transporter S component [Eubacteriaceae bacterium ES3]|nr:ECF transporter S component [Eubacteriaceae bacterium ES3]